MRGPGRCMEGESDAIKGHSCPLSRGSRRGCAVLPSLQDRVPSCVCTGSLQQARLWHQETFGWSGKSGHGSAPTSVTQMTHLINFSESKPETGKGPASHPQQSPDKRFFLPTQSHVPGIGTWESGQTKNWNSLWPSTASGASQDELSLPPSPVDTALQNYRGSS